MTKQSTPRGGKRPGAGRRAGSLGKKALAKRAVKTAVAAVVGKQIRVRRKGVVSSARPGISPKDLLLDSMRAAWESIPALTCLAIERMEEAARIETASREQGRPLTVDEVSRVGRLHDEAAELRLAATGQHDAATDLAVKVAPYEHAKLAQQDTKVRGNVIVNIRKF